MSLETGYFSDMSSNPIDNVEEVLEANRWVFNRTGDDELMVQVHGRACEYKLFFIWQEDENALQFCCEFERPAHENNLEAARTAVLKVNENLWFGHFDLPERAPTPRFRYACLLNGLSREAKSEQISEMVRLALDVCEQLQPAFQMLSLPEAVSQDHLALALSDARGRS